MQLDIVVSPECRECEEARAIAKEVQARFPLLEVRVVELDDTGAPSGPVTATPTYLLDGKVVALGNPRLETLELKISRLDRAEDKGRSRRGRSLPRRIEQAKERNERLTDSIVVYGTAWCGDCHRARRLLDQRSASYTWIDIDRQPEAKSLVLRVNGGRRSVPTIFFPDGAVLVEPSNRELEEQLQRLGL